jgi:CubicO group peptidase (beta-lactamase class C family)
MPLNEIRDSTFLALCDEAVAAMERYHVPGVALGVIHSNQEFTAGFGVTSVEHPLPVDADTLFQIGSTTKTFTATLAMRLVETGKLDLDMPIRAYLPDLRLRDEDVAARVALRHLLTHRGGWVGDYFEDTGDGDDALARYVSHLVELPQITPLGEVFHYNNAGFALVGRVIESVTGKTYEAALKELVLDPLELKMTFFFPRDVMTRRFVVGHHVVDGKPQVAHPWPIARSGNPVGGIAASVKDQLRYARFCLGDGAPLLTRAPMRLMQSPQADAALDEQVGLAWFIKDTNGTRIIRHGGATLGQMSAFLFVPSRGFAMAVLTNANRGAELHRDLTTRALELYLDIKESEPAPLTLNEKQLAEYAGRYRALLADVDLSVQEGGLLMRTTPKGGFPDKNSPPPPTPPPSRLVFIRADRVLAIDGESKDLQGEFLRGADGRIVWFRFGSRIRAREE